MNPKPFLWLLTAILLVAFQHAAAQQPAKQMARIGYLASTDSAAPDAFRRGLRDLGYVEGRNIAFEFRASGGKPERNADLALELVSLNIDLIVAEGAAPSELPNCDLRNSYFDVGSKRSDYFRVRCQAGASGREYHRVVQSLARVAANVWSYSRKSSRKSHT